MYVSNKNEIIIKSKYWAITSHTIRYRAIICNIFRSRMNARLYNCENF